MQQWKRATSLLLVLVLLVSLFPLGVFAEDDHDHAETEPEEEVQVSAPALGTPCPHHFDPEYGCQNFSYNEHTRLCTDCGLVYEPHHGTYEVSYRNPEPGWHWGLCASCSSYGYMAHEFENGRCIQCGFEEHECDFVFPGGNEFIWDDGHTLKCTVCGYGMSEEHTFNAEHICTVCGYSQHEHNLVFSGDYWDIYEDGHSMECTICGLFRFEEHKLDKHKTCTVCGYTVHEHQYTYTDGYRDETHHSLNCPLCSISLWEEHTFDASGKCTVCGYVLHAHEYVYNGYCSDTDHSLVCSICGLYLYQPHSFDASDICTVCGYQKHAHDYHYASNYIVTDTAHYLECSICGHSKEEPHTLKDGKCTVCGYFLHTHNYQLPGYAWFDEDNHYLECTICRQNKSEPHDMKNGKCAVCGYFPHNHLYNYSGGPGYSHGHYVSCAICGDSISQAHTIGQNGACSVCGYYSDTHEYVVYDDIYFSQIETHHYMRCLICGETKLEPHTSGASCSICGYRKHTHSFTYSAGDTYHTKECAQCNYFVSESHTLVNGKCTLCGYADHVHTLAYQGSFYDGGHTVRCSECGLYASQNHSYNSKTVCTVCGYKPHLHSYSPTGGSTKWYHMMVCSQCGNDSSFPHIFGRENTCAVCGMEKGSEGTAQTAISVSADKNWMFSGKSLQLKADPAVKDLVWLLMDGDEAYASIDAKGKLTAKAVSESVKVTVIAASKSGAYASGLFEIIIHPLAQHVSIRSEGGNATNRTLDVDVNTVQGMTFQAIRYPEVPVSGVVWATTDTKGINGTFTDNGDGTCTVTGLKLVNGKAATVILTAAADDGSGVKSTVTLKLFAAPAPDSLSITEAPQTVIGGKSAVLKAAFTGDAVISDKTVLWSVRSADAAFASIDAAGKLTAKAVSESVTVVVTAASRQNPEICASAEITVLPLVQSVILSNIAVNNTLFVEEDTIHLTPVVYPSDASCAGTWKSSSTKIAAVNADGTVTFLTPGTVTITFTAGDGSKKAASIKLVHGTPVSELTIDGEHKVIGGSKLTLKASINEDASVKTLTWSSSDPSVASVSSKGVVTAKTVLTEQEVLITAAANDGTGLKAEFPVVVMPKASVLPVICLPPDGIGSSAEITGAALYLPAGTELKLGTIRSNAKWTSSNKAVAAVETDEAGGCTVSLLKAGSASITVKEGSASGKITLKVGELTEGVTLSVKGSASTLLTSGKGKITLAASPVNASAGTKTVAWSSSDPSVASVSNKGVVTAKAGILAPTVVTITAAPTDGCQPDSLDITVLPAAAAVSVFAAQTFDAQDLTVASGEALNSRTLKVNIEKLTSIPLFAKVYPAGTNPSVTWKTSSAKIATVETDENGRAVLKLKGTGTVTVTATANDGSKKAASFKLNVVRYATELRDDTPTHEVAGGKKLTLKVALGVPSGLKPTSTKLVYSLDAADKDFASVSAKGVLTAKKVTSQRTVTVTVTYQDDPSVVLSIPVSILP